MYIKCRTGAKKRVVIRCLCRYIHFEIYGSVRHDSIEYEIVSMVLEPDLPGKFYFLLVRFYCWFVLVCFLSGWSVGFFP